MMTTTDGSKDSKDFFKELAACSRSSLLNQLASLEINTQLAKAIGILRPVDPFDELGTARAEIDELKKRVHELEAQLGDWERYRWLREMADYELDQRRSDETTQDNNAEYEMYG